MKAETFLLSLILRFLEVGRERQVLVQDSQAIHHHHTCSCECSCVSDRGLTGREGFLLTLLLVSCGYILYQRCRKEDPPSLHGSPRRKGGGVVVLPAGR